MVCTVGQTPRGDNFFPRQDIVSKVYRRLENSHVYISAPRRVGKTAVMRYLQDSPKENYEFIYIITQALGEPIDFYKRLLVTIQTFKNLSQSSSDSISKFFQKISKIELLGVEIDMHAHERDYLEECKSIFRKIDTNGKQLVIMIDEFAQTVDNIWKGKSDIEARRFLYANREIQEEACENIRFIYTGSLGLDSLCKRLDALDALSKLNTVEMGPLSYPDAYILCYKILESAKIVYQDNVIDAILKGVQWLIPFHIQLILQRLIDLFDEGQLIEKYHVELSLKEITTKRGNQYFDHYHNHIKKAYEGIGNKYLFIKRLLTVLTQKDVLRKTEIIIMAEGYSEDGSINNILETLEYDGYIYGDFSVSPAEYRFTSPIIRMWWGRNMS